LPGIAGKPPPPDERSERQAGHHEQQAHGIATRGERGGIRHRHRAGEHPEEQDAAGDDEVDGDEQAHGGQAVAIEPVEPDAGLVEIVGEVGEDRRSARGIGGELLRRQPLHPLLLVLLVEQQQHDPDRQAAGHVPRCRIQGLAVRPERGQAARRDERELNGKAEGGRGDGPPGHERIAGQQGRYRRSTRVELWNRVRYHSVGYF
jgi:hypothetical protein